jgi:hypothetical protein
MIAKTFKNVKAHFSPLCFAFPIVSSILGMFFIFLIKRPSKMTSFEHYLLFGFVLALLISVIMRTLHHGLAILSGVVSFIIIVFTLLMFRFALGVATPSNAFLADNVKTIIILLIALNWTNIFVP